MSVAGELTFHLEDFEGPLELLLALVTKHKMDLHDIPILQLIEYDQCRRMAALLREKAETAPVFVRRPMEMDFEPTYDLHHSPQVLADCWAMLSGRTKLRKEPTQQQFEPLVTAPMVSVTSRVVYILRHLISGTAAKMSQLFSRQQTRSTNVATFLALLELVRGGRVKLDGEGRLTMQRGRIQRDKEKE